MSLDTLPPLFWILYYLFLLIILGTAIFAVIKQKMAGLSMIAIIFAITVPFISLINSIGRPEGLNEFEYFSQQLLKGSIWTIYAALGYLYLVVWWVLFLRKK